MFNPETAAWGIAAGMTDMVMRASRLAADARDRRIYNAWDAALAEARDDAGGMARVAAAAINKLADAEAEIAQTDREIAQLRKSLRQRNELLRARQ